MADLIILREDEQRSARPGGVDLMYEVLTRSRIEDIHIQSATLDDLHSVVSRCSSDPHVYIQTEGRLSRSLKTTFDHLLAEDAKVIEKNTFALPSQFRPNHPNYLMCVMSKDGLYRYALRSRASRTAPVGRAAILPNARLTPAPYSGLTNQKSTGTPITLLRVGRPDESKWSDWEISYAQALARKNPDRQFELILVGLPATISVAQPLPTNLALRIEDYTPSPWTYYEQADALIHYSRIGETYGNTVFEAAERGLRLVVALEPRWDCAPAEFLDRRVARIGTRRQLLNLASISDVLPRLSDSVVTSGHPQVPDSYARLLVSQSLFEQAIPIPSATESIRYVLRLGAELGAGHVGSARAAATEVGRAIRDRRRWSE